MTSDIRSSGRRRVDLAAADRFRAAHAVAAAERAELAAILARQGKAMALGDYRAIAPNRLSDTPLPRGGSADSHLDQVTRDRLLRSARTLDRNNCLARGMIDRLTDLIVGTGFSLQAASGDEAFDDAVESMWAETRLDYRGQHDNDTLAWMIQRQALADGDVLPIWVAAGGGAVQCVGADRIVNPAGSMDSREIVGGVKLDAGGRPTGYHVAEYNDTGSYVDAARTRLIGADAASLVATLRTLDQTRGEPALAPAMWVLDRADAYLIATITAAEVAAMFALLIKVENPGDAMNLAAEAADGTSRAAGEATDAVGQEEEAEPGMFRYLQPGESVEQVRPEHPGQQFDAVVRMIVRLAGVANGLPIELALLDTSESNFSAGRMVVELAMRGIARRQKRLVHSYLSWVYRQRVAAWLRAGVLAWPRVPDHWSRHQWSPPAKPQFDPKAAIDIDEREIALNIKTAEEAAKERGRDWRTTARRRRLELAFEMAQGLRAQGVTNPADAARAVTPDVVGEIDRQAQDDQATADRVAERRTP